MKNILILSAVALTSSAPAFAASQKICFGTGFAKGSHFVADLTAKSVTIHVDEHDDADSAQGKHKANGTVQGRDGVTYISYPINLVTKLLVDEELLKAGTKGLAKIRRTDDRFDESVYFCRDAR